MSRDKYGWLTRINSVLREYSAMRQAADRLLAEVRHDPSLLRDLLKPQNVVEASNRLEGTYLLRLFAEFESGLRLYWGTRRKTRPKMETLLDQVAALLRIDHGLLSRVHRVREHRNGLVHEREAAVEAVPIHEAKSHLCTFFDRLPERW